MPRNRIPSGKKWSGIFPGVWSGNIWSARNIDLERSPGSILPSEMLSSIFDSDNDGDLGVPVAFVRTAADGTDRWWALGGAVLFKSTNTDPESSWAQDAIASSPTDAESDIIEFADALISSSDTDLDRLSTTWTNPWWSTLTGAAAMTTSPHRFGIFAGALLITDGRFINSYDGTVAIDPDLTLPADFEGRWIKPTADYAMIGTTAVGDNMEAEIFFWDRASSTYNARYPVEDRQALCGFIARGIPYIITKRGAIKRFTGQGFRTVQQFPSVELRRDITDIHPNGVSVIDESLVLINVDFGTPNIEAGNTLHGRLLSGVWIYNVDTNNLYHHLSPRNDSGLDYGQQEYGETAAGAIVATQPTQGRYLIGAKVYKNYAGTDNTTRRLAAIFTSDEDSTSGQRGYVITPKISSKNVRGFWKEIYPTFRRLLASGDRLRILYRIQDSNTLPEDETITWASTTTFTGANDNVIVGDFVEVIAGDNAGLIARITAITDGAPNTFTIDLTVNSSTKDARARYWNFIDLGTVSSQATQKEVFRVARESPWVQFLFELRGNELSPQLEDYLLDWDELSH